jgi:uncharacterized protein (DUF433 family)
VEVLALLAKHELRAALEQMAGRAAEDEHLPTAQRPRQQQRRLASNQVDEVVAKYIAGEAIDNLAREYDINRTTVIAHVEKKGVERRGSPRKLTDARVSEAADRYAAGLSLAGVAAQFGVCDRTLRREFRKAGVPIRSRSDR